MGPGVGSRQPCSALLGGGDAFNREASVPVAYGWSVLGVGYGVESESRRRLGRQVGTAAGSHCMAISLDLPHVRGDSGDRID